VTVFGSADVVSLAVVLVAVALEVRQPRRGLPVMALLGVAGLQRPEAWLLSAAYWVYLFPGRDWRGRLALAAVAAAAPAVWLVGDLAYAGHGAGSLERTQGAATSQASGRGLGDTVVSVGDKLRDNLRLPALVVSLAGLAFALRTDWRRARLPAAVIALGAGALVVFGMTDLPILARFALEPAALLTVFFGVAAFGWLSLREGAARRVAAVVGMGATAAVLAATAVVQAGDIGDLRNEAELQGRLLDDFQALDRDPGAHQLLHRCDRIYLPHHRPTAFFAYELRRPLGLFHEGRSVGGKRKKRQSLGTERPVSGLIVNPVDSGARSYMKGRVVVVPKGFHRVAANRSWVLYLSRAGC
jgi:hypothetical protein